MERFFQYVSYDYTVSEHQQNGLGTLIANEVFMSTYPLQPKLTVVAESRDFRQQAGRLLEPEDLFLEIGCSFGECTKVLAEKGCRGIALDHSADAVALARKALVGYPDISVIQMDARDMADIQRLCPHPSVILFDVGGNESLDKVISLLRLVLKSFRPRLILVRSMELAELASLIQAILLPDRPHLLAPFTDDDIPRPLLELSHSPVVKDRLYAIQRFRRVIDHPDVTSRLEELCADESRTVRKQARHALRKPAEQPPILE